MNPNSTSDILLALMCIIALLLLGTCAAGVGAGL